VSCVTIRNLDLVLVSFAEAAAVMSRLQFSLRTRGLEEVAASIDPVDWDPRQQERPLDLPIDQLINAVQDRTVQYCLPFSVFPVFPFPQGW
jgi:hypothetical protein